MGKMKKEKINRILNLKKNGLKIFNLIITSFYNYFNIKVIGDTIHLKI